MRFPGRPGGPNRGPGRRTLREEGRRLAVSLARLRDLARRLERDGRALRLSAARLRDATRLLPLRGAGL